MPETGAPGVGPLAGVRVLSLAEQYPGPYATLILADLGADVVLIERPDGGDPSRRFAGHFEALNRNKRSVVLDLKQESGRETFLSLVESADVVIEGFRPGVMLRLGLDEAHLRELFPRLVYASISSFGQTGPLSPRAGHDIAVQGMSGFVSDGSAGQPAAPATLPIADLSSAMFAVIGIVAALFERQTSSRGRSLDVAMLDALLSWRSTALVSALNNLDPAPYPPDDPGYGVFEVGEQRVQYTLSITGEDHHWRTLCHAIGLPELAGLSTEEREADRSSVDARLRAALASCDPLELERTLEANGVSLTRVLRGVEAVGSAQAAARGIVVEVDGIKLIRQPILIDGQATPIARRAPRLGEHTAEILGESRRYPY